MAMVRIIVDDSAERTGECRDGRRLRTGGGEIARRQIDRRAAFLVAMRIVADQAEREIVAWLAQRLSAHHPAVAFIDPPSRDIVLEEAVAFRPDRVEPGGDA